MSFPPELLRQLEALPDRELLGILRVLSDEDLLRLARECGPVLLDQLYQACCVRDDCRCSQGLTGCAHATLAPLRPAPAEVEGEVLRRRNPAFAGPARAPAEADPSYTSAARTQTLRRRLLAGESLWNDGDVWVVLNRGAGRYRRLLALMTAQRKRGKP